jgi:hypothetical protein
MSVSEKQWFSAGDMARANGAQVHQVEYIIRKRHVRPVDRAGGVRLFSASDAQYISSELARTARERGAQPF